MNPQIEFQDLGRIGFKEAWVYQQKIHDSMVIAKDANRQKDSELPINHVLFCEHDPVLTLGKSGSMTNLLIPEETLHQRGISLFRIDRGGDITYHGPGQIMGYPILDLEQFSLGVRRYIEAMEEAIIITLNEFGIQGIRSKGETGVWLKATEGRILRKICAIGVRVSRGITMHGFALNVSTDLDYFRLINPCGLTGKGVTSMDLENGLQNDPVLIKNSLKKNLAEQFLS